MKFDRRCETESDRPRSWLQFARSIGLWFIICGRSRALAGMLTSSPTNQDLIDSSAWGKVMGYLLFSNCYVSYTYYVPAPIGWGMMHWWPLSVCLSPPVSPVPDLSREWKGIGSMGDSWAHLMVKRWRLRVSRPLNAVPSEKHLNLRNGKAYTNFKLGIRIECDDPHHRHARCPPSWKLWVALQVTVLAGGGAYCCGPNTGRTAF